MVRDRGFEPLTPTVSTCPDPPLKTFSLVGNSIQSSAALARLVLGMQPAKAELFSSPTVVAYAKSLPITRDRSIFSYIVSGFTGTLRFLTLRARGELHFDEQSGGTLVRWSYTFEARSVFTFPFLFVVVRPLWQAYMRKALQEALAHIGPDHDVA
jgi:hypothetical protein